MKICEYFSYLEENLDKEDKENWGIRIYTDDINTGKLKDSSEAEYINQPIPSKFSVTVVNEISKEKKNNGADSSHPKVPRVLKLDFESINKKNKQYGDVGERIVVDYEINKLITAGRSDLANKVDHISVTKGDVTGYDVLSYSKSGDQIFIEVKTTPYTNIDGFYLSKNEKEVALEKGENYFIYRIYDLNIKKGSAKIHIFDNPTRTNEFEFQERNWLLKLKNINNT